MPSALDSLRSEIEGKLEPPLDVMLDPSLLAAETTLERLSDSTLFEAQTQATLGQTPTQPRVDSLFVPSSFYDLLREADRTSPPTTSSWTLFRRQAEGASVDEVVELLGSHGVEAFDSETAVEADWETALNEEHRTDRLISILREICGFLNQGGILLSRTSASLDVLRDAGVVTIDLGQAELEPEARNRLLDIGYQETAPVCAFGIANAPDVAPSLVSSLLSTRGTALVYRLGT